MVQSMFNYQHIADEKIKYEKEAAQRMIIIYQILIVSTIILIIGFFILKKEQKKKKKYHLYLFYPHGRKLRIVSIKAKSTGMDRTIIYSFVKTSIWEATAL